MLTGQVEFFNSKLYNAKPLRLGASAVKICE